MTLSNRKLSKIAVIVRDRLQMLRLSHYREVQRPLERLLCDLEQLRSLQGKLEISVCSGWSAAARRLSDELSHCLDNLPYGIGAVEEAASCANIAMPSVWELLAELQQAEKEFGQVHHNRQEQTLTVSTEPIELEGVYLGEFEIRLLLADSSGDGNRDMYRVVAVDPHPASGNEAVTHPHVSDQRLCPGDAGAAIQSALRSGWICDFFLLVNSVLSQYNSSSAYVELEQWDSVPCYECAHRADSEELCRCWVCENDFCDDCISYCRRCDASFCSGCLEECSVCEDPVCPDCLTDCPECRRRLCQTCLDEKQCPCIQEKETEDESDQTAQTDANRENAASREVATEVT